MKAWRITGVGQPREVLQVQDCVAPLPGAGEVQIKVASAGIGLPDVLMCKGKYAFSPTQPFTPGQEVAGVISAVGAGSNLQLGQRVMGVTAFYGGNGSLAEYCLSAEHMLFPVSDTMSDVEAAAFCIPYHTAWVGLKLRAKVQAGDTVLIHGAAGGSGSAAIQLAKALGLTVIAAAGSAEKQDYCRKLGADHCVNSRGDSFVEAVLEITAGRGVEVVYDPVGGEVFEQSLKCTASGGSLLAIGFACGRWGEISTQRLVGKNCSVMGVYVGAYSHAVMLVCHQSLMQIYAAGGLRAEVEQSIPFHAVADYLQRLEQREIMGKLVMSMAAD